MSKRQTESLHGALGFPVDPERGYDRLVKFLTQIDRLQQIILAWLICGIATGSAAQANEQAEPATEEQASVDMVIIEKDRPMDVLYGEIVNRVFAPRISDWIILDSKRLILYATRSRPYLVTLRRPANSLTSSTVIGLERRDNSIDARFDQIYVDGFPHVIERIEKLTVETAKRLRGIEPVPDQKD